MSKLIAILRIRVDETSLLLDGYQVDSIRAFKAAIRAASEAAPGGFRPKVAFVLAWPEGSTFFGSVDLLGDHSGSTANVVEFSMQPPRAAEFRDLVELAHLTRSRLWLSMVRERLARTRARAAALQRRLRALAAAKAAVVGSR